MADINWNRWIIRLTFLLLKTNNCLIKKNHNLYREFFFGEYTMCKCRSSVWVSFRNHFIYYHFAHSIVNWQSKFKIPSILSSTLNRYKYKILLNYFVKNQVFEYHFNPDIIKLVFLPILGLLAMSPIAEINSLFCFKLKTFEDWLWSVQNWRICYLSILGVSVQTIW